MDRADTPVRMEADKSVMEKKADLPWLALLVVGFLALGTVFALYMVSWDAEWGFLYFGYLSLTGEVRLFQDEIVPRRLPLPFHVIGISQLLGGPSLLAARLWSLLLGALTVVLTFVFGRSLGGRACGFLTARKCGARSAVRCLARPPHPSPSVVTSAMSTTMIGRTRSAFTRRASPQIFSS